MFPYRESRLAVIFLGIFFLVAIGYAFFEARGQLLGPTITLASHDTLVHEQVYTITGKATRISSLSMNGDQLKVTEDGSFSEMYLLAPGYNRIILDAKDAYGRVSERVIEIMYLPEESALSPATSTSPIAPATSSKPLTQPEEPQQSAALPQPPVIPTNSGTPASSTPATSSAPIPIAPASTTQSSTTQGVAPAQ